jgi:uncharacterized membrane protein
MEISPQPTDEKPVSARPMRDKVILFILGLGTGCLILRSIYFLRDYQGAKEIKIALFLAVWYAKRYRREDELEILMNRRALAFAFYAALVGVIVVSQLEFAGIIPVMMFKTYHLFPALVGLMMIGLIIEKIRYR